MDLNTGESAGRKPGTLASARARAGDAAPDGHSDPAAWPLTVIESEETGVQLHLSDLWSYRELLYFLTLRDLKVRYKQTLMGVAWVVVQPLMIMLIVRLIFGRFAGLASGPVPYPLLAYSGLLLWTFFSNAVVNSTNSLISNAHLITKVYFPRMFIPVAAVAAGLVDLAIASVILVALAVYYGVTITWGIALLPLFVLLTVLLALGIGLLVSALTVKYRDLRHTLPFVVQFWMLASPVFYPASAVPENWRRFFVWNPLTGILEGFRASLTGQRFDWAATAIAAAVTFVVLAASVYVFRRTEDNFADLI